jgi:myo-inositol 2-dehydrogenase/D-chiro-inositol 1-dehydrogenase
MIGAGWIATDHVARLRRFDGVELVGVCDVALERARALAGSASAYSDWRELIERESPDAVFVCTPPRTHREIAVTALEQGMHIYLEKPIARGLDDARAIVEAASRAQSVCAIGYQYRAVEALDALREALEGQEIGLLIGIATGPTKARPWFLDRAEGGGNLLERASHQIDLERAVGGEILAVQAAATTVPLAQSAGERGDIEDAAALVLHFAGGAIGTIQIAWTRDGLPGRYSLDVLGSDSSLHLELDPGFALSGRSQGRPVEAAMRQHPHDRTVERFLDAARTGDRSAVFCTPADAAGTLAVVIACEEAVTSGATVAVPRV